MITFICAKDPYEAKYQLLINKQESAGLEHLNHFKAFLKYYNDVDDIKILTNTIQIKHRMLIVDVTRCYMCILHLDVRRVSMSTVSFLAQVDSGIFLPMECFLLTYDLNSFKPRLERHLLLVGSFEADFLYASVWCVQT